MKKLQPFHLLFAMLFGLIWIASCKKNSNDEVIAGFSFTVDAADYKTVKFTSAAQNATSLSWDFGDGSTSSETNPTHTFANAGTFSVKLTATGADNSDIAVQNVAIVDPNAELTKLVGADSKTWKLLRSVGPGRWPLEVGPIAKDQVWWAQGKDNDEIANRPCLMNDEYTFYRNGDYKYDSKGDFWAEGGVFDPSGLCQTSSAANLKGPGGIDLSAFGDGTHTFALVSGNNPTLEVKGLGAFIGLQKIGTDSEVSVPQLSVKYDILKLTDGAVDTLIIESKYKQDPASPTDQAYWKITLVHYDNPADEPAIPSAKPVVNFTGVSDGLKLTLENKSSNADSYLWEFGDGATSTENSPVHTYANSGAYKVKLTGTNAVTSVTVEQEFTITSGVVLESDIIGGAWKVRPTGTSVFVGPGLGNSTWYVVPEAFLAGTDANPENDWSCMTDDEFIFKADHSYQYKTNGTARNDSYMGSPNGCIDDAAIAASGNGAAFGSATHTFSFVPAASGARPRIILTNGPTGAAFVGFYKGYYGGENADKTKAPNGGATTNEYEVISYLKAGGVETLTLSVDISADKSGGAAWSVVLVR